MNNFLCPFRIDYIAANGQYFLPLLLDSKIDVYDVFLPHFRPLLTFVGMVSSIAFHNVYHQLSCVKTAVEKMTVLLTTRCDSPIVTSHNGHDDKQPDIRGNDTRSVLCCFYMQLKLLFFHCYEFVL